MFIGNDRDHEFGAYWIKTMMDVIKTISAVRKVR
uniref:Uncharacterized protein n=1 Tax=Tetranychus urticae TaxID=32264 RepID=T1KP26_TETUR